MDSKGNVVLLNKTECANHLINRLRKRVCKFARDWTKKGFEEREVKRNADKAKRDKLDEDNRRKEEKKREMEEKKREKQRKA